jgi:hypothetical protein
MTIYTDLNIIDDFEERHGIEETLRRARTFMISYLEMMTDLPEPTRHSLEVANRFSECLLTSEDLANERKSCGSRPPSIGVPERNFVIIVHPTIVCAIGPVPFL